jgi:epoxyqueuosine reductase
LLLSAQHIKQKAQEIGFDACGIAQVTSVESEIQHFDQWIAAGYHAGMHYMKNHRDIRFNPDGLVEGARSVISVALNYYPQKKLSEELPHIAYYAYGKDYHIVVKEMLQELWKELLLSLTSKEKSSDERPFARCFTDSAPILERYWAWKAGLGWIGKNTNLIIPGKGSFFFLGELITTCEVDVYDIPQKSRCGNCTRCLDACPTGALEQEKCLNANKCLSYLTIENREEIPTEQAKRLGNRIYGCDTCQEICPWNRFASPTTIEAFHPTANLLAMQKEDLKHLSREDYNRIFTKSAIKRAKYEGLLRNIKEWSAE